MKHLCFHLAALVIMSLATLHAEGSVDPFTPYLDGKTPEIVRKISNTTPPPEGITLQRLTFRLRDSEVFAVVATPKTEGKHPGILVLHGGGGIAEVDKAMAWAQRGYVAVAPDLPGIAEPKKLTETKGRWNSLKYGDCRWVAEPDASASVIFDAVLSAMKSLYLLRAQPSVDPSRIGVVGISWGGYMTAMVCGLAGDQVKAGFALYGCGFFEHSGERPTQPYNPKLPKTNLWRMPDQERERWLQQLDAGRRAPGMKAAYFLAAASNDFFGWPRAAHATLAAVQGEKNQLIAPNANHSAAVPGGSVFEKKPEQPFTPTAFQPLPTPTGQRANWLAMEIPYFEYYLKGIGKPFPKICVQETGDPRLARISINAPHPITKVEVYWSKATPALLKRDDVVERQWLALPATSTVGNIYEAKVPEEAAEWFALASDDRPVTVSSDMVQVTSAAH